MVQTKTRLQVHQTEDAVTCKLPSGLELKIQSHDGETFNLEVETPATDQRIMLAPQSQSNRQVGEGSSAWYVIKTEPRGY